MTPVELPSAAGATLEAELNYCVDTGVKPVNETFASGDMNRQRTGRFEPHAVTIHDGRPARAEFRLDTHGFEFVDHLTAVRDFFNPDEVAKVYYPEIERLVAERTGATRVLVFDHTVRAGDESLREDKRVREPVKSVHNDYTDWSGPQRVRDLLPDEADHLLASRFAVVQVWRPIAHPVSADPLAICDARTLDSADLVAATRKYPDRIGETYQISYNPAHCWFYFPEMRRDEALVFKVYESERDGRARFTAHSAFSNPASPAGAPARQSIEMRTLAFFATDY